MFDRIKQFIAARVGGHASHDPEDGLFRAWVHLGDGRARHEELAHLEVSYGRRFAIGGSLKLREDYESPVLLHLGLGVVQIYLGLEHRSVYKALAKWGPRLGLARDYYKRLSSEFGVELFSMGEGEGPWLSVRFNTAEDGDSGWPRLFVNLYDALFGSMKRVSETKGEPVLRTIYLPEGAYTLRLTQHRNKWKRSRIPWSRTTRGCEYEVVEGAGGRNCLPIPGKGESAHDLDEDGIFSGSCREYNVDEACGYILGTVMRDRARRAGPSWLPEPPRGGGDTPPPDVPPEQRVDATADPDIIAAAEPCDPEDIDLRAAAVFEGTVPELLAALAKPKQPRLPGSPPPRLVPRRAA